MKQDNSMKTNKEGFENYMKSKAFAKSTIEHGLIMIGIYFKWLKLENMKAAQVSYNDLLGFMKYSCFRHFY